jgi:hypothetical protein
MTNSKAEQNKPTEIIEPGKEEALNSEGAAQGAGDPGKACRLYGSRGLGDLVGHQ